MRKILGILLGTAIAAQAGKTEESVVQLLENGQFSQAQDEVNKSGAKGDELVRLEAFLYQGAGMSDSALVYLRRAYETTPKDPRIELRLAEVLVWKKDLVHARAFADAASTEAIAKEPRPWESQMRRAEVYLYMQDLSKARRDFQDVAADRGTPSTWSTAARVNLAQIAAWEKDFPRSLLIADSVLNGDPGQVPASLIKGQVLEWEGKYPEARKAYTQALQKHPDDWQLRQRLEKLSWLK